MGVVINVAYATAFKAETIIFYPIKTKSEYLLYIYGTSCGICQKIKLNIVEALQSCSEDEIETPFYAINIDVFGDELIELGLFSKTLLVLIGACAWPIGARVIFWKHLKVSGIRHKVFHHSIGSLEINSNMKLIQDTRTIL